MKGWIIFGCILFVFWLIGMIRANIEVCYSDSVRVAIRVCGLRIVITPKEKKPPKLSDFTPKKYRKRLAKDEAARLKAEAKKAAKQAKKEAQKAEKKKVALRLIVSAAFLIPLMYVTMGHMLGLPLTDTLRATRWAVKAQPLLLSGKPEPPPRGLTCSISGATAQDSCV